MKKRFLKLSIFVALFLPVLSFAQDNKVKSDKKDQIHIRVEKDVDGKKEVFEKRIDASNLTPQQREAMVQKIQDSLAVSNKGNKRRMKIEISDDNMERMGDDDLHRNVEKDVIIKKSPTNKKFKYRYYNDDKGKNYNDYDYDKNYGNRENGRWNDSDFDLDMGEMGQHLRRLGDDIPRMIDKQVMVFNNGMGRSTTVRGLDVFPNNPKTEILNLNFNTPEKGTVFISVVDIKGNVIAKDEIKDFSGEYVGQINIGKAEKGTYFVMVTQNGDGVVKRVAIP